MRNVISNVISVVTVLIFMGIGLIPIYIGYLIAVNYGFVWFIVYLIIGSTILAVLLQTIILFVAIIIALIQKLVK